MDEPTTPPPSAPVLATDRHGSVRRRDSAGASRLGRAQALPPPPSLRVRRVLFALWTIGIVLLPLYLRPSGTPQLAHAVLAVLAVLAYLLLGGKLPESLADAARPLAFLAVVTIFVNGLWDIHSGNSNVLRFSTFYVYNFLIFRAFLALYSQYGRRILQVTVVASTTVLWLLAAVSITIFDASIFRSAGFFNNPNQLAYYAIIVASLVAVGSHYLKVDSRVLAVSLLASGLLVAISNSKAGILAYLVLVTIILASKPRVAAAAFAAFAIAVLLVGSNAALRSNAETLQGNVQARLLVTQSDDSLEARGYNLLADHPIYLVVGAGEGDFERFGLNQEIHSTPATVAFAYGLTGLAALAIFLVRVLRPAGLYGALMLLPVFLYGLTHNGVRFTMMWVLLAFVLCAAVDQGRSGEDVSPSRRRESPMV